MNHIARRAQLDASTRNKGNHGGIDHDGDNEMYAEEDSNNPHLIMDSVEESDINYENSDGDEGHGGLDNKENVDKSNEENSGHKFSSDKGSKARVLDVNEREGCASMHVPGQGIKLFHYSNLYDGITTQSSVYSNSATDSVVAALNGFNSCILCYGQTGAYRQI